VENVLSRFGYSDYKPISTCYDANMILQKKERIMRDQLRYSQIIGSLMYFASIMRPDILFGVSKLIQCVSNPRDEHWCSLERVSTI
jgi:hypothetical protein